MTVKKYIDTHGIKYNMCTMAQVERFIENNCHVMEIDLWYVHSFLYLVGAYDEETITCDKSCEECRFGKSCIPSIMEYMKDIYRKKFVTERNNIKDML